MLRMLIVCNIGRQMMRKNLLLNMTHVNVSKPNVFLHII